MILKMNKLLIGKSCYTLQPQVWNESWVDFYECKETKN